jgi:hypothetical protein
VRRAAGTITSASAPRATRAMVTTGGRNASNPYSIQRKDDPQIDAAAASRPHSTGPNASGRVPWVVVMSRERAIAGVSHGPAAGPPTVAA